VKIVDLEKFCLEHIYWPYQDMIMTVTDSIGREDTLKCLNHSFNLDNSVDVMKKNTVWAELVLDRINRMRVYFPDYIQHPIVELIREYRMKWVSS
jgi:hypothetical protein